MKRLIALSAFSLVSFVSFAQQGTISGKITDNNTKQPVENAMVVASQNNMPVKGTTTDKNGNYTLNVPVGRYDIKARKLDYGARMLPYINVTADKPVPLDILLYPKQKPNTETPKTK